MQLLPPSFLPTISFQFVPWIQKDFLAFAFVPMALFPIVHQMGDDNLFSH
jgi:hypothetical protein